MIQYLIPAKIISVPEYTNSASAIINTAIAVMFDIIQEIFTLRPFCALPALTELYSTSFDALACC